MQVPAAKSRVIRFGVFEVDLQEAELRKSGIRIKLQEQPFQILTILLERPGQTVIREELRRQLWPADTFVDFDHSLNSSIKKLREALGDDSENPRFIETLHRRGYRFIAPVDGSRAPAVERSEQLPPVAAAHSESSSLARWQKWAATVALFVGAMLLGLWLRSPLPAPRVLASQELTNDADAKLSLVTDGNRVYFTENSPDHYRIGQVSIRGGEAAPVDVPFPDPVVDAVSAERSELLIERANSAIGDFQLSMWSVPIPAGSPRTLGDAFGHDAVWSPTGKLAFAKGNDFYIAEHDGANPRKFATAPDFPTGINFSPDGNRFRFTVTHLISGTSTIWEARADGSDMHPLFPGWNNPPAECWPLDSRRQVLRISKHTGRCHQHLDYPRPFRLVAESLAGTGSANSRTTATFPSTSQHGRQETVRDRHPPAGGVGALRLQIRRVCNLSRRIVGGRYGLFTRWAMDDLCQLSRRFALAQ